MTFVIDLKCSVLKHFFILRVLVEMKMILSRFESMYLNNREHGSSF